MNVIRKTKAAVFSVVASARYDGHSAGESD